MTNEEFDTARREAREYVKRTSFPAPATPLGQDVDDQQYHGEHAEYGGSHH
jgi:hypothetical protein